MCCQWYVPCYKVFYHTVKRMTTEVTLSSVMLRFLKKKFFFTLYSLLRLLHFSWDPNLSPPLLILESNQCITILELKWVVSVTVYDMFRKNKSKNDRYTRPCSVNTLNSELKGKHFTSWLRHRWSVPTIFLIPRLDLFTKNM